MVSRVPKTRGGGRYTEAGYFGYIRATLREKSMYWPPKGDAKKRARRSYKGPNKRQRFEYKCNHCKAYFPDKEIEMDHIVGAGRLKSYDDLPRFVKNLFCEEDNYQALCKPCHKLKTDLEKIK